MRVRTVRSAWRARRLGLGVALMALLCLGVLSASFLGVSRGANASSTGDATAATRTQVTLTTSQTTTVTVQTTTPTTRTVVVTQSSQTTTNSMPDWGWVAIGLLAVVLIVLLVALIIRR